MLDAMQDTLYTLSREFDITREGLGNGRLRRIIAN